LRRVTEVSVAGRPRPIPDGTVRRVVESVVAGEAGGAARISVTFLGRDPMRRLNREYKGHDRPTDVIAFALETPGDGLVGDVYVCPWVARREASARRVPFRQELVRLLVHGTLHVLGHEHPEDEGRERSPMWRRQERYVARLA
jgi:probable rRNA maturation factor